VPSRGTGIFIKTSKKGYKIMAKQKSKDAASEAAAAPAPQTLPLAVQLYTLRNWKVPPEELFATVASIGYSGVELAGTYGLSAADLRTTLEASGLKVVSAHVSLNDMEASLTDIIRYHKALGNETLIVPWVSEEVRGKTAASWQALGQRLGMLARRCEHAGMRFMYHNHDFEMVVIDGRPAIEWLMEGAKDGNVGFEIDVAWVQYGGQDVPTILAQYAGKCSRIHAKDLGDNAAEHGLADVGSGKLNWDVILPAAKAAGVEWYIVEHDYPTDAVASIRQSYEFLSQRVSA
jgi:sugar phosphate isomerase/epimerase